MFIADLLSPAYPDQRTETALVERLGSDPYDSGSQAVRFLKPRAACHCGSFKSNRRAAKSTARSDTPA